MVAWQKVESLERPSMSIVVEGAIAANPNVVVVDDSAKLPNVSPIDNVVVRPLARQKKSSPNEY
jgi:hypothetical protein